MDILFYTAGWIEGASKKDATVLVKATAEKQLSADSIGWYNIFEYKGGMAWELYEGGDGKSYLESTLKAFSDAPEGKDVYRVVKQQDRYVRIDRVRPGIRAILMPEGWTPPDLDLMVIPSGKAKKVADARIAQVAIGTVLGLVGAALLYGSFSVRITPFEEPAKVVTKPLDKQSLPHLYWEPLRASSEKNGLVEKMILDKGVWKAVHKGIDEPVVLELPKSEKKPAAARGR